MAKAHCKCKQPECEECPEWIFTFADLVMLMMGFFVILWVLKPAPGKNNDDPLSNKEWLKVAAAIREAFGYIPDPNTKDPVDIEMLMQKLQKMKIPKGPGDGGQTNLPRKGAEGSDPEVTAIRPSKQVAVGGRVLFDPGSSRLTPESAGNLDQVAEQIRGHRNLVMVKGHASLDDFGDGGSPQQRMDLSLRRAQVVADYLTTRNVEPEILRVQGCSVFEPVVERAYTPNAQALNRRTEVEATATLVSELQDRSPEATPAKATEGTAPQMTAAGAQDVGTGRHESSGQ